MKCIFCQQNEKLTKEHVLPNWLCKLYPNWDIATHEFTGSKSKTWQSKIFQLQTKVVCKKCNSGWMSDLEQEVRPILTELVNLNKLIIDKKSQDTLAFWIQKTVLMLNQALPNSLKITQDLYEELYKNKSFSKKAIVNLGWRMNYSGNKLNPLASFQIKQIQSVDVKKELTGEVIRQKDEGGFVWSAVMAIGPLVFELVGHNMNIILEINTHTKVFEIIRPYKKDIEWPLEWPIEAEGGLDMIKSRS